MATDEGNVPLEQEAMMFDFSFAFDREEFSDRLVHIVLEIGEDSDASLPVHREVRINSAVVAAKSAVIREMICSSARDESPIVLRMQPEEVQPFLDMLKFIYHGALQAEQEGAFDTLVALVKAGDKFDCEIRVRSALEKLKQICKHSEGVDKLLSADLGRLEQIPAVQSLIAEARERLVELFKNVEQTWESESFLRLSKESVLVLLQSDSLGANEEDSILGYVRAWVCEAFADQEARKEVMRELSNFIRFPVMRGETLQEALEVPEMALCKDRIMAAAWYKTFSGRKRKRELAEDVSCRDRTGIVNRTSKLVHHIVRKQELGALRAGKLSSSNSAILVDTTWGVRVGTSKINESYRVGAYLEARESSNLSISNPTISYQISAKIWPAGLYVALKKWSTRSWDLTKNSNWGTTDLFGQDLDDLLQSQWFDEAGKMHVLVHIKA